MMNVNYANPQRRLFLGGNYQLSRIYNFIDSDFSLPADNYDLGGRVGSVVARRAAPALRFWPTRAAEEHARGALDAGAVGARPTTIITGFDNNGDTVMNDRPDGVDRNTRAAPPPGT